MGRDNQFDRYNDLPCSVLFLSVVWQREREREREGDVKTLFTSIIPIFISSAKLGFFSSSLEY